MKILAYADRVSACPGETISVMVSCQRKSYEASLVRVIQGDTNPDGPGYREERVGLELGGPFRGRFQPIHAGSFAQVDDNPLFDELSSFALVAAVWPTTPGDNAQTIMARRNPATGAGFELGLDEQGTLAFAYTTEEGVTSSASTGKPLFKRRWYAVSGSYDTQTGRITVGQTPLHPCPRVDDIGVASAQATARPTRAPIHAPLTLASRPAADRPAERLFNGRIDSPRLFSHALCEGELVGALDVGTAIRSTHLLAAWDFSLGIPTDEIIDVSSHRLHGHVVNLPTRGVTGYNWHGRELNWAHCAAEHGAIHFHDDDLYDVGWDVDFSFRVPGDLHSGIYAVRLQADGDEYFVPFCIRPPRGKPTEPVAFLMPTASYLAYANNRIGLDVPETELVCGRLLELTAQDLFMQEHPELGLSFYDLHNDGSGVFYSSRLRPIIDIQPKFVGKLGGVGSNLWQFNADTHILGWLEAIRQPFDVITDEDLDREGLSLLEDYQAVITGTHPEYCSGAMLDALQAYIGRGGRLLYLGGNGFYWRIAYHPNLPGVIECRKSEDGIRASAPGPGEYYSSFTGEYTGLWRRNGRAPNCLVGVGMAGQGFDVSSPYHRTPASHDPRVAFVFAGVEEKEFGDFGLSGGGAAGLEVDAANCDLGTPPHALVLASSQIHTDLYLMTPEDMLDPAPGLGGTEADAIRSDMVFFESPNGGAVVSTGSIAWAGAMAWNGYDNHVARITENVLRRFLDPTPFQ